MMNDTNNITYYGDSSFLTSINLGIGVVATILNSVVFVLFVTSKELRRNSFYRLLLVIYLFHAIESVVVITQCWINLTGQNIRYVCQIIPIVGSVARMASITQTGIVAMDRFQASLMLTKPVLHSRRLKLGIISVTIFNILLITFSLFGVFLGEDDCVSKQYYGDSTRYVSRAIAIWIIFGIFFIEVPFCIMTFYNIRKKCKSTGAKTNISCIKTNTEGTDTGTSEEKNKDNFPQGYKSLQISALKVLGLIVITHLLIFFPQFIMMIAFIGHENRREVLYDYAIFLQVLNYLIDPITCCMTVKPIRKALTTTMFKIRSSCCNT